MGANIVEWVKRTATVSMEVNDSISDEQNAVIKQLNDEWNCFSDLDKKRIVSIFDNNFESNDLIYIYSVMAKGIEFSYFSNSLLKALVNSDYDGYFGSFLEYQTYLLPEADYSLRTRFHDKNVNSLINGWDLKYDYIPMAQRDKNKIVIFTEQLLGERHAPSLIVLRTAYALQKYLNYDVTIFSCPIIARVPDKVWFKSGVENHLEEQEGRVCKREYMGEFLKVYQVSLGSACDFKEIKMMYDLIYAWKPLFVCSMGSLNPVIDIASSFVTEVNSTFAEKVPMTSSQILLMDINELVTESNKVIKDYQKAVLVDNVRPFFKKSEVVLTKEGIGLSESAYTIAIVGNRLDKEIDKPFADAVSEAMKSCGSINVLIFGNAVQCLELFDEEIRDRIHNIGYCEDLMAAYTIIDLYVNPVRMGGGYSAAMALASGIPVVSLKDCDVHSHCGDRFAVADLDDMKNTIIRYVEDEEFAAEKYSAAEVFKNENSEERYFERLSESLKHIIDEVHIYTEEHEK